MGCRVLLIGLDGFDPDLCRRFMGENRLPGLKKAADEGVFSPLKSTVPPFTYPAWSTCLTGVNPGRHGIIDFAERIEGTYRVRFINATHRLVPTIFARLSAAGYRVGAMGFPTTYPPEPVNGFMIAGFDSPLAVNADASFCYPPELFGELGRHAGAFTLAGIQEVRIGRNWHRRAAKRIPETLDRRTRIAEYLLRRDDYDLFAVVFSEPDTVSHHFWSFFDPGSPRRAGIAGVRGSGNLSDMIPEVYHRVDEAIARLRDTAGRDHTLIIVSDHGFGGTGARWVSLNRMLETGGFFRFKNRKHSKRSLIPLNRLVKWVPAVWQEALFRRAGPVVSRLESDRRLADADLSHCIAFSDELNYFPSVWLHDQRFPAGRRMTDGERNRVLNDISDHLISLTDPETGRPFIRTIHRREAIYSGPAVRRFPDLVIEFNLDRGYAYPLFRAASPGDVAEPIPPSEMLGRKGGSMNGSHRPFGVFIAHGPDIRSASPPSPHPQLADVTPTILSILGCPVPDETDGRPLPEILTGGSRGSVETSPDPPPPTPRDYSADQSKIIEDRLKNLGYFQ